MDGGKNRVSFSLLNYDINHKILDFPVHTAYLRSQMELIQNIFHCLKSINLQFHRSEC